MARHVLSCFMIRQFLPKSVVLRLIRLCPRRSVIIHVDASHQFAMNITNGDEIALTLWRSGLEGFEPETTRVWIRLTPLSSYVIDVGANTGLFSLLAAALTNIPVISLEPLPRLAAALRHNIRANQFSSIAVIEAAASDRFGRSSLHVPLAAMPTEASLIDGFRSGTEVVDVATTTLDHLVERYALGPNGLIKIDAEAAEHLVLAGAVQMMRRLRPTIILEVLFGRNEAALRDIADSTGYVTLSMNAGYPRSPLQGDPTYRLLNWILVPVELEEDVRRALTATVTAS